MHPVKLAIPNVAAAGFVAQVRVAPAGVVNVRVTGLVLVLVVLPAASWMVTTGWLARAVPLIAMGLGAVVKASLTAVAAAMDTLLLVAEVRDPSVAVSV